MVNMPFADAHACAPLVLATSGWARPTDVKPAVVGMDILPVGTPVAAVLDTGMAYPVPPPAEWSRALLQGRRLLLLG